MAAVAVAATAAMLDADRADVLGLFRTSRRRLRRLRSVAVPCRVLVPPLWATEADVPWLKCRRALLWPKTTRGLGFGGMDGRDSFG